MPTDRTIRRLRAAVDLFTLIVFALGVIMIGGVIVEAAARIVTEVAAR